MRMHKQNQTLQQNQSGLVSFMVVSVLMLVLTLIVVSYARIVSREQIQTLDRQLNAQALYAAESGVNDAAKHLADDPGFESSDNCADPTENFITKAGLTNVLDDGVSYECIIVNKKVQQLKFPGVSTSRSVATRLKPSSGSLEKLTISWESPIEDETVDLSSCPGAGDFPQNLTGCDLGMVRFELVDFGGPRTIMDLMEKRWIGILQPSISGLPGGEVTHGEFTGDKQGTPVLARCSAGKCSVTITGLSMGDGYLRLRSIYKDTPVTITGKNSSGEDVYFVGSQVEIDVTGRAGGVVKRIKVNKQIGDQFEGVPAPEFAIQTNKTICKGFTFVPGEGTNVGHIANPGEREVCDPAR